MRVSFGSPLFQTLTLDWAHGQCAWFALAAAARWHLPLVGFFNEEEQLVHVACQTDAGLFDAYGLGTPEDTQAAFHRLGSLDTLMARPLTEATVRATFGLTDPEHDAKIQAATDVCETLLASLALPAPQYTART